MFIHLACNYSRHLLELLEEKSVRLDFVKLSMYDRMASQLAAVQPYAAGLVHTLPHCGLRSAEVEKFGWDHLNTLIERSGSPFVGAHLDLRQSDLDDPVDLNDQDREQVLRIRERVLENLHLFKRKLGVPLLLENVPYNPAKQRLRTVFDPVFIRQILREAAVDFLLDLAHARCAAHYLGVDVHDYLEALPLDKVREIHASGPHLLPDGVLDDSHYPMQEVDYRLLEWTLRRCSPQIVTLEYGGVGPDFAHPELNGKEVLLAQWRRIAQLVNKLPEEVFFAFPKK